MSGGVTTLVDMPLNSVPPTTTVANLDAKRAAARGQCWADVAFWGGVVPGNQVNAPPLLSSLCDRSLGVVLQAHLKPLVEAGVRGFKCFLIESGVDVSSYLSICVSVSVCLCACACVYGQKRRWLMNNATGVPLRRRTRSRVRDGPTQGTHHIISFFHLHHSPKIKKKIKPTRTPPPSYASTPNSKKIPPHPPPHPATQPPTPPSSPRAPTPSKSPPPPSSPPSTRGTPLYAYTSSTSPPPSPSPSSAPPNPRVSR